MNLISTVLKQTKALTLMFLVNYLSASPRGFSWKRIFNFEASR